MSYVILSKYIQCLICADATEKNTDYVMVRDGAYGDTCTCLIKVDTHSVLNGLNHEDSVF